MELLLKVSTTRSRSDITTALRKWADSQNLRVYISESDVNNVRAVSEQVIMIKDGRLGPYIK